MKFKVGDIVEWKFDRPDDKSWLEIILEISKYKGKGREDIAKVYYFDVSHQEPIKERIYSCEPLNRLQKIV